MASADTPCLARHSGPRSMGFRRMSVTICFLSSVVPGSQKGVRLVRSSYMVTPRLHRSHSIPYSCDGAGAARRNCNAHASQPRNSRQSLHARATMPGWQLAQRAPLFTPCAARHAPSRTLRRTSGAMYRSVPVLPLSFSFPGFHRTASPKSDAFIGECSSRVRKRKLLGLTSR